MAMDTSAVELSELLSVKDRFSLAGKNAFVTGAAGGIGRTTAAALAELGANVALVDMNMEVAEANAAFIAEKYGVDAVAIRCDVTDEAQVDDLIAQLDHRFGSIDCVHSNAGIVIPFDDNSDMHYDNWQKMMEVNLSGMFLINQRAANYMKEKGTGGAIVNTASQSGKIINRTYGNRHQVGYTTSKAGVIQLTKAMAVEYVDYGIRINCISPGFMFSGLHKKNADTARLERVAQDVPMGRFGTMNEIGGIVAFLLSPLASYITGADFAIDGGYTCW